ncbi:MAG: hypothetical protein IPN33_05220 [Saprospiraceae bacterium]|nr:hypothetical protein [Saprospiraceae bacterium]
MARRNSTPSPTPQPKRRPMGQLILLLLGVFILFSIALQKCGFKVVNNSEDSEIIDKPHRGY